MGLLHRLDLGVTGVEWGLLSGAWGWLIEKVKKDRMPYLNKKRDKR